MSDPISRLETAFSFLLAHMVLMIIVFTFGMHVMVQFSTIRFLAVEELVSMLFSLTLQFKAII